MGDDNFDDFKRDFKGVWIPKEVYLDRDLNSTDKILLTEIASLDSSDRHCYAGNEYFSKFLGVSDRTVRNSLSKLKQLGFIEEISFDGRIRTLKSNIKTEWKKTSTQSGKKLPGNQEENFHHINTVNNIDEYSFKEKEIKEKENNQLSIVNNNKLQDLTNDMQEEEKEQFLQDLNEFCKARVDSRGHKVMDKTDRAKTMLINKLTRLKQQGQDISFCLSNALANRYTDVYPDKNSVAFQAQEEVKKQQSKILANKIIEKQKIEYNSQFYSILGIIEAQFYKKQDTIKEDLFINLTQNPQIADFLITQWSDKFVKYNNNKPKFIESCKVSIQEYTKRNIKLPALLLYCKLKQIQLECQSNKLLFDNKVYIGFLERVNKKAITDLLHFMYSQEDYKTIIQQFFK